MRYFIVLFIVVLACLENLGAQKAVPLPSHSTLSPYEHFQWSVGSVPNKIILYKETPNATKQSNSSYKEWLIFTIKEIRFRYDKFIEYAKTYISELSDQEKQLYEHLTKDDAFLRAIPDLDTASNEDLEHALMDIHKNYYVPRSRRNHIESKANDSLPVTPASPIQSESNSQSLNASSMQVQKSITSSTNKATKPSSSHFPIVPATIITVLIIGVIVFWMRGKS